MRTTAVRWLVSYALALVIIFGLYWLTERYEALVGLRILWVLFGWASLVWVIWRLSKWAVESVTTRSWKFGLPWRCVLRGHAVVHIQIVEAPDEDGSLVRYEVRARRSCARCTSIAGVHVYE